jgi:uncharacterized protein (TIGR03067 family)
MKLFTLPALALVLLAAVSASLTPAQEAKNDLAKRELKTLQGTWVLVGRERGGEKVPEDKVKALKGRLTVNGDRFTFKIGDLNFTGTVTLDPSKSPKHLDATLIRANGEKGKLVGIYELQGDTLRECFDPKERPTEFRTRPGSEQLLETFRREKE